MPEGPDAAGWSGMDAALLRAADELHDESCISDPTWDALAAELDEHQLIEVCMVVGQYHLVAFTLNSLGVQLEDDAAPFPRELAVGRRVLVVGAGTQRSEDPGPTAGERTGDLGAGGPAGASLALADRDEAAARDTARLVEAEGTRADIVVGDVTDEAACHSIVEQRWPRWAASTASC